MAFRRYWAIVFVVVLLLPTIGLVAPDLPAPIRTVQEPKEDWWVRAAERLDPYIDNVFGFRGAVLAAHATYGRWIGGGGGDRVLRGEGGALFLKEEQSIEQSLGQLVRPDVVARVGDVAATLDAYMQDKGGRFVMLVPPNGATTNFQYLPAYARRLKRAPTEYDLLAEAMKARGIPFVDMRPILEAAKADGPIQNRLDTHWSRRGALLGFNAAMAAVGRPDLEVSPADALGPLKTYHTGDLLRLMGETSSTVGDLVYEAKGPMLRPEGLKPLEGVMPEPAKGDPFPSQAFATGHDGPRILVIGDSFTQGFWPGLLAYRASAYGWMHHRYCRFDMGAVRRFNPDILIYAPTERQLPCRGPIQGL